MSVKTLGFGQNLPSSGNNFLRLKQKGDRVQFKIAQEPVYTGKHFIQQESGWSVLECNRIMNEEACEYCDKYFEIMNKVKKMKDADPELTDKSPSIKPLLNEARGYRVSIQWYIAILDRVDGKFKVLQTTNGVRNKFNAQFTAGVDVFKREWILANTGSTNPNEIYMLTPVDSADVNKTTPEEEDEFMKAKEFNMSTVSQGSGGGEKSIDEEFPDKE